MRWKIYTVIIFLGLLTMFLNFDLALSDTIDGRPILSKVIDKDTLKYVGGEILVKVKPNVNLARVSDVLLANQAYILRNFNARTRWGLIGCDTKADVFKKIKALKASPLIEWAEPNYIVHLLLTPNDEYYDTVQWPLNNTGQSFKYQWFAHDTTLAQGTPDADIDAPEAWDIETGDSSLIIAVLDTGIPLDYTTAELCHPDLNDTTKYDLDLAWNCIVGPEGDRCVPNDTWWVRDMNGHGTHVTGIISAMTNNIEGIAGTIWDCKIMVITVLDWRGIGEIDMLSEGIRKAYENGAEIINISAGAWWNPDDTTWQYRDMEDAIAEAESAGCLVVCAAGNYGENTFVCPACYASWGKDQGHEDGYSNVIAVGATDCHDSVPGWSSYHDSLDITVVAPGDPIFSTVPNYSYFGLHLSFIDTVYAWGHGTSMASPHVAGVAGLIKSRYSSLNPYEIRTRIEKTADDVCDVGWDERSGYGRLNAWRALGLYGELASDTIWRGDVWISGDIVIPSGRTLFVDSGTVVKFIPGDASKGGADTTRCEIIVNGGTLTVRGLETNRVILTSAEPDSSSGVWHGIRVISGNGNIGWTDIKHAQCGVNYTNSASNTIRNCYFLDNGTYAIRTENSNLMIDSNLVEDSSSVDTTIYGIYSYQASPTIDHNHIKDCKYGIYIHQGAPTVKSNKIERGQVGLYCNFTGSMTAKRNCFTGGFSDCYVKNNHGALNLDTCYMEGDAQSLTPTGVRYQNSASGWIRHCGIFNYENYGVYAGLDCPPDLGNGYNQIYSFVNGNLTTAIKNSTKSRPPRVFDATNNYWGTAQPGDSLFEGAVLWFPYLTSPPLIYDACAGFQPPPPKIVSATPVTQNFSLSQNYPNPFNPSTVIQYTVSGSRLTENSPIHTTMTIYNILGQKVKTVVDEAKYPGTYEVRWDGKDEKGQSMASGIYFYRLKTDKRVEVKKMLLVK